jgi:hypothetical protein
MPEFWDFEDLMFGAWCVLVLCYVNVRGLTAVIGRAHVYEAGMFASSAAVSRHATSPARGIHVRWFRPRIAGFRIRCLDSSRTQTSRPW